MSMSHRLSGTKEYSVAYDAEKRCNDRNHPWYHAYGGRGIRFEFESVVAMTRWLIENMPRPDAKVHIDRIDNDGPYAPGNLRWSTIRESSNNRRTTKLINIGGVTKSIADWARHSGISITGLHYRMKSGMPKSAWLSQECFRRGPIKAFGPETDSELPDDGLPDELEEE